MAERPKLIESQTLPCGCIIGTAMVDGIPAFVMEPCSTSCEYYLYAVEQAKLNDKPIELRSVD